MKKIITFSILIVISVVFQMIVIFPWWSFLVPVFLLGAILPLEKWRVASFLAGFVAGFFVWALSTLYFELSYKGEITQAIGKMMSVPYYLIYVITGLMGGTLTGLAFYSGFLFRRGREMLYLELPKN